MEEHGLILSNPSQSQCTEYSLECLLMFQCEASDTTTHVPSIGPKSLQRLLLEAIFAFLAEIDAPKRFVAARAIVAAFGAHAAAAIAVLGPTGFCIGAAVDAQPFAACVAIITVRGTAIFITEGSVTAAAPRVGHAPTAPHFSTMKAVKEVPGA